MCAAGDQGRRPAPGDRRSSHPFHRAEGRGNRRRYADRSSAEHHHDRQTGGLNGHRSVPRHHCGPVARRGSRLRRSARRRGRRSAHLVHGRSVRIHPDRDQQRQHCFGRHRRIWHLDRRDDALRNLRSVPSTFRPTAWLPPHPNRARRTAAAAIHRCPSPVVATPHQARPTWPVTSCLRRRASDPTAGPVGPRGVRYSASHHARRPHHRLAPDAPGLPRGLDVPGRQPRDQPKDGVGHHSDAVPRSWDGEDAEKT